MTDWRNRAECRDKDPELFFPTTEADRDRALAICDQCAVKTECLAYYQQTPRILGYPVQGVWGGVYFTGQKGRPPTMNRHG